MSKLYWYAYRLRGFSPSCQPKGFIDRNDDYGRFGSIAYDRPLTEQELSDYELDEINEGKQMGIQLTCLLNKDSKSISEEEKDKFLSELGDLLGSYGFEVNEDFTCKLVELED
ncbi:MULTISPECIES: hypothetical protein [unclassified Bacillus cereus group]|uniref:defense against restriction DarA-related protein n=1 Tax=unclassified Bacillus cereus group TaxID=2750818 RepID=UPI001F5A551E|nr:MULTISPECIES: hypothetical protein [unclassified Bacillus cereus group]